MLDELAKILPNFLGANAHIRCMAHTINLTAKAILHPFEPIKPRSKGTKGELSNEPVAPDDIGLEELYAQLKDIEENGEQGKDNVEGFVNVLEEMTEAEQDEWRAKIEPVKQALYKVCTVQLNAHDLELIPFSCARSHTKSSTQPLSSYLDGESTSLTLNFKTE